MPYLASSCIGPSNVWDKTKYSGPVLKLSRLVSLVKGKLLNPLSVKNISPSNNKLRVNFYYQPILLVWDFSRLWLHNLARPVLSWNRLRHGMVLGRGQQWPVSLNCKFIVDVFFLHSQAQTGANSMKHFELVKDSENFVWVTSCP